MTRKAVATHSTETALDRDTLDLHEAVADLVRVYQFRDRDRICCHDVSMTQCYALETIVEHGPLRLDQSIVNHREPSADRSGDSGADSHPANVEIHANKSMARE
jgi:hypothetical protein